MSLSNSLVEQFVKVTTNKDETAKESTVYGTIVKSGNTDFVQLDGSELLTPITSTISVKDGDRVTVMIKNHTAVVTGNISSPSPSGSDLDDVENNLGNQITELGTVIATKVSADELEVEKGRIDNLITDTVLIKEELVANEAIIEDLQAEDVEIKGTLTALNGQIQNLDATKIDADIVEATYATIENLEATNLDVYNLNADYASFKSTTTDSLTAINADIEDLDTTKLDAEYANLHYANIDFTNIGDAAIENFFSKSGMIEDLVVSSGTITGQLVGVTISGDLIEGNTIKADKLVVLGSDGLYYKLNVNAETVSAEQTEYNSLNGSIITANTITAEKINVDDLVAFDATIGGFKITSDSIYSGVKESATNTTRGIYMDDTGQFSIGDSNNYLRYYKDDEGNWRLEIASGSSESDISVGGTNLLLNSKFDKNINHWNYDLPVENNEGVNLFTNSAFDSTTTGFPSGTVQGITGTYGGWWLGIYGNMFFRQGGVYETDSNDVCSFNTSSAGQFLTYQNLNSKIDSSNLAEYYTISCNISSSYVASENDYIRFYINGCNYEVISGSINIPSDSWATTDNMTTHSVVIKITEVTGSISIGLQATVMMSSIGCNFNHLKISEGNIPNPEWTPAPEDDGDNLFLNSAFNGDSEFPIDISTLGTEDTPSDGVWYYSTGGSSSNLVQNDDCFSVECSFTTHNAGTFMLYQPLNEKITDEVLPGYYTISGDFAVEGTPTSLMFYPNGIEYTNVSGSSETITVTSEFTRQRFACQITAIDSSSDDTGMGVAFGIYFAFVGTGTCKLKFKNLKISEGNVGHPIWTPAQEEIPDPTTIDIVTVDGITSAVINSESSSDYIDQNVVSRLITEDKNKIYSFGADVNLVGTDTTSLVAELYAEGKYTDSTSTLQDVVVTTLKGSPDITEVINDGWTRLEWIFYLNNVPDNANAGDYLNVGIKSAGFTTDNLYFKNLKFEKGNTPTDWSPAPGDVDGDIQDIQNATESVNDKVDSLGDRVTTSETSFQLLKDSISMLVTDANGESMMTQTSNGWTFNMSQIEENIDTAMNGLDELAGSVNEANQAIKGLDDLTADLVEKTAYITMAQDDEGDPYIELGRSDVEGEELDFKVRITNTSMDFMQGTSRIAYVSNNMLYIEKALIKNELQIGEGTGFVWKKRSNGNMGLRWVGG